MRLGLTGRILLAGGIVVAVLLVRFVLLVHAFHSVTAATGAEEQAETSVTAASRKSSSGISLKRILPGFAAEMRFSPSRAALPASDAGTTKV